MRGKHGQASSSRRTLEAAEAETVRLQRSLDQARAQLDLLGAENKKLRDSLWVCEKAASQAATESPLVHSLREQVDQLQGKLKEEVLRNDKLIRRWKRMVGSIAPPPEIYARAEERIKGRSVAGPGHGAQLIKEECIKLMDDENYFE